MKKLFVVLCIVLSFGSSAQSFTVPLGTGTLTVPGDRVGVLRLGYKFIGGTELIVKYDTTVLYVGQKDCDHLFVEDADEQTMDVCSVNHGLAGCPVEWYVGNSICRSCLKHIRVKETRTVVLPKSEYAELLEKLKTKLNK